MRCLICHTPDHARPGRNGSDFEALFGGLVRQMSGYVWTIESGGYTPWAWPRAEWSEEVIEAIEAVPEYHDAEGHSDVYSVIDTSFMLKYMKYLNDFWIDIHAFASRPISFSDARYWTAEYLPNAVAMPDGATHAFINVDGCHWAMLTDRENHLNEVIAGWQNVTLAEATEITDPR